MNGKKIGIIALTTMTGLGHIASSQDQLGIMPTMFILDGILFMLLLAALYFVPQLKPYRKWVQTGRSWIHRLRREFLARLLAEHRRFDPRSGAGV